jgi:hypothetical protein
MQAKQVSVRLSAALLALAAGRSVHAQTTIVGGNITTTTWTLANSPYNVLGDITIPMGSTLTIEPGVVVRFAAADGQGAGVDPAKIEVTVAGTLLLVTTAANPITFEGLNSTAPHTWHGIILGPEASSFSAARLIVRHAHHAFTNSRASFTLDHALIAGCSGAALLSNTGASEVTNVDIRDVGYGLWARANSGTRLTQCSIQNASIDGVLAEVNSQGQVLLYWTTIDTGAGNGVHVRTTTMNDIPLIGIYDSIVSRLQGRGVWRDQSNQAAILSSACDFWGNVAGDLVGVTAGPGCISADPMYKPGLAPRLRGGSPCIDRGLDQSPDMDLLGNPRNREGDGHAPFGASDLGCYEVPCFANCDESSAAPVLNVLDFNCYLNRFATGEPYANCDGSTIPPALNVLDFNCFLGNFAAGCPGQ